VVYFNLEIPVITVLHFTQEKCKITYILKILTNKVLHSNVYSKIIFKLFISLNTIGIKFSVEIESVYIMIKL